MTDDRVDELEAELEATREVAEGDVRNYQQQVVGPALEELESDRDDARAQRVELQDDVATLRDRVRDLEVEFDSVVGLAEDEKGGPDTRATPTCHR